MALKVGDIVADFKLPDSDGNDFELYQALKEGAVVLYFYPKDFTRGCTAESCMFRDNYDLFTKKGIRIVGINTDSAEKHRKFKATYNLPFPLLIDRRGRVSKQYKALFPVVGLVKRVTYLIDTDKKIVSVTENLFDAERHINDLKKRITD